MQAIQTESISEFRNNYHPVLKKLADGPVLLIQRSSLAAIMVSPELWNAIARELEELRDLVDVLEAKLAATPAEPQTELLDIGELEALMGNHAVHA